MDKETLLIVLEALNLRHFDEQGKIDPSPKGASNELKSLRQISRVNGISDCINIVSSLVLQCENDCKSKSKQGNLKEKYGITDEELKYAVDQINFGRIACDGVVLCALVDLVANGDI